MSAILVYLLWDKVKNKLGYDEHEKVKIFDILTFIIETNFLFSRVENGKCFIASVLDWSSADQSCAYLSDYTYW